MTSFITITNRRVLTIALGFTACLGVASAEETQNRGWRKVTDPAPPEQTQPLAQTQPPDQPEAPNANASQSPSYPTSFPPSNAQPGPAQQQYPYPPPGYQQRSAASIPSQLTLRPGTFVSVLVNNPLSSDHNQQGDAFTATLSKPLIVDGVVIAHAGQTIGGRVTEAQKAGRVSGTSRLGLQLTELTLVDGTQIPFQSDLVTRNGHTSVGNDVGVVGTTTAVGAAIGAAADWGRGAAIGAGAGAAAGILGVLLTRGQPTVVYPETLLMFRVTSPAAISTDRAPQAFRYADEHDYQQNLQPRTGPPTRVAFGPAYPPYYPAPYPYYYGPSYIWGPSFGVYVGPRYHYYGRRW